MSFLIDDAGIFQQFLQVEDLAFNEGLFIFCIFVLGVLRNIAEFDSLLDTGCYFFAAYGFQVFQLYLLLLQTFQCNQYFLLMLGHYSTTFRFCLSFFS